MAKAGQKIELLEESIGQVQNVLDNAQHVLGVADRTQQKAGVIVRALRRVVLVVAIGAGVWVAISIARRRSY